MDLKILSIDHYQTKPLPFLDQCKTQFSSDANFKVPVLRIFGVSSDGKKACLHIHQVYPYFYIPLEIEDVEDVSKYIQQLGISLNAAVNQSFGNKFKQQSIMAIRVVKGIPFYGFHAHYKKFLKIYLLDPKLQTRIIGLLHEGAVMGKCFKVYDDYQFIQQFMIDYNLFGMDIIKQGLTKMRQSSIHETMPENTSYWERKLNIKRASYCEWELDSWGSEILNRSEIQERPLQGLIQNLDIPAKVSETPLVQSLKSMWVEEEERRSKLGLPQYVKPDYLTQREPYEKWFNEDKLRDKLMSVLASRNFTNQSVYGTVEDDGIPTAFQAVGLLHPKAREDGQGIIQIVHAHSCTSIGIQSAIQVDSIALERACTQEV